MLYFCYPLLDKIMLQKIPQQIKSCNSRFSSSVFHWEFRSDELQIQLQLQLQLQLRPKKHTFNLLKQHSLECYTLEKLRTILTLPPHADGKPAVPGCDAPLVFTVRCPLLLCVGQDWEHVCHIVRSTRHSHLSTCLQCYMFN